MEKRFKQNNHGTILTIINNLYYNNLGRVISNDEIENIKYYMIEKPLGITFYTYEYTLFDITEYICMYSDITIYDFLHGIIDDPLYDYYYGYIFIYGAWTCQADKSNALCSFCNVYPCDINQYYFSKYCSLKRFLEDNSFYISECEMATMCFMGYYISIYQTNQKMFIVLNDNEKTVFEKKKEFHILIDEINKLIKI